MGLMCPMGHHWPHPKIGYFRMVTLGILFLGLFAEPVDDAEHDVRGEGVVPRFRKALGV